MSPDERKSSSREEPVATREETVVSRAEEQLRIDKRSVETATVLLRKSVEEHTIPVDVALLADQIELERVPVNREVSEPEPIRTEGDTVIVPIYEEVLVVQKKLVLTEELRMVHRRVEASEHREERVRSERIDVERRSSGREKQQP